jgi:hypothetical protein
VLAKWTLQKPRGGHFIVESRPHVDLADSMLEELHPSSKPVNEIEVV